MTAQRAAVVTGGAGGIGRAICDQMRTDGYYVISIDLRENSAADQSVVLDLADLAAVADTARSIAAEHAVAALVHTAAAQPLAGAGALASEDWQATLAVNLISLDVLVGGFSERLAQAKGSVTAVSSVHASNTTAGIAAYATSKAAMEGWVRAAALDLGPDIRVNAVAPGAIDTPKLREGFARWGEDVAAERLAELQSRTPLGRIGTPEEIAQIVAFLAGPSAGFITGSTLVADGGALARLGSE